MERGREGGREGGRGKGREGGGGGGGREGETNLTGQRRSPRHSAVLG